MEENLLIKISLFCIVLGLPVLYLLSSSVEKREHILTEDNIQFKGEIIEVTNKEDTTFLQIVPETPFPVIIFDKTNFQKGQRVEIEGKIDYYKGNLEIIADRIS